MKLNPCSRGGFTLVEIMIVVSLIGVLSAIAVPNFIRSRSAAQADACLNNLRQLEGTLQQWMLENGLTSAASPDKAAVATYLRAGKLPTCPAGNVAYVFADPIGSGHSVTCPNVLTLPGHALP